MKTTIKITAVALGAMLMSFSPISNRPGEINAKTSLIAKSSVKWKSTEINLGEIAQNKPVTIEFEFTNVGENPILISNVQASCGCTSTNFEKTPILPGENTKITAVFNAAAKGVFKKQVTVTTNGEDGPRTLTFNGTVI